jgi:AcrR family transcriptional regulator
MEKTRVRMAGADRREAILASALDAFAGAGYHETSLDAVAERAGISKALIYEHFASKLLMRVIQATSEAEAGEARLRSGLEAFLDFVEERRDAWRFVFRNVSDPEIADAVARLREEVATTLAGLMAADAPPEWNADPELAGETEMIAQELTGAVQALANWWDEHRDVPRERIFQSIMDFAWVGLERLGEGRRWGGGAA